MLYVSLLSPTESRNLAPPLDFQVGVGPCDAVRDGAVQEVGGVPRGGAGAAAAEAGRTQEEEDNQQAQGDAPDRGVSESYRGRLKSVYQVV